MDDSSMTLAERLNFVNQLRSRSEQVYGRSPEELAELAARGIIPPTLEELQLGIRVLRRVRLGQTVAPAAPAKGLPPGVAIDDF